MNPAQGVTPDRSGAGQQVGQSFHSPGRSRGALGPGVGVDWKIPDPGLDCRLHECAMSKDWLWGRREVEGVCRKERGNFAG